MQRVKFNGFLISVLIFGCFPLFGQETQPVDSLFYLGVSSYQEGEYQEAIKMFDFMDRVYPQHSRSTAALLMKAKSNYKLKKYQKALELFRRLSDKYPGSQYEDDAQYGSGTVFYRLKQYKEAVNRFIVVVENSGDKNLRRKAASLSSEIMDNLLTDDDLRELLDEIEGEKGKAVIVLRLAQREMNKQQYQSAKDLLQSFLTKHPNNPYVYQIEQAINRADSMGQDLIKLGVILPLTGSMEAAGKRVLEGIQQAVKDHNHQKSTARVELVIRDSKGKVLNAIRETQDLCDNTNIVGLIGDLSSDVSAAVAAVAQEKNVPLLAPTATELGLTEIGDFIFQMNCHLQIRAETLAEYAVNSLGLRRFAILAPGDDYGSSMTQYFSNKIHDLKAEVLVEKWYFEGAEDLGPQFKALREFGIRQMMKDSLLMIVPEELMPDIDKKPGIIYVDMSVSDMVDSTDLAITAFDGIFLPIYSEDLKFIIPQFAKYNIMAKPLGGVPWNNEEALADNERYINGAVFLGDFYKSNSDIKFNQFKNRYRRSTGHTPEKLEVLGYDAASFMTGMFGEKAMGRHELRQSLTTARNFEGMRGPIAFNQKRVNTTILLLQFKDGTIDQIR